MSNFDDERQRSREAILKRRAKLVAFAVAAGVASPACGGKSNNGYCLSIYVGGSASGGSSSGGGVSGSGGTGVCLQPPGGTRFCLSIAAGTGPGGTGVCLGMPYGGESSGGVGGAEDGGAGEGGVAGGGGVPPICLSPPFFAGSPPIDDDADDGEG